MSPKLTPETLLSLPRTGGASVSPSGEFYLISYSHFDFDTGRTTRNVSLGKVPRGQAQSIDAAGKSDPAPVLDFLKNLRYGGAVWLDDSTVLYLRPRGSEVGKDDIDVTMSDKDFKKKLAKEEDKKPGQDLWCKTLEGVTYKIGEVPVEISDLKVAQASPTKSILAFSAEVYPEDPSLDAVERLDKDYEAKKNGADVQVYDKLFVRHWDTWTSDKKKLVFFVELEKKPDVEPEPEPPKGDPDDFDIRSLSSTEGEDEGTPKPPHWSILTIPVSPLADFPDVECPSRPFGDSSDFDISATHLVFTSKDPNLPEAWHTRMHVYLVPLYPKNKSEKTPKCLTSQGGARSGPVFSAIAKAQPGGRDGGEENNSKRDSKEDPAGKIAWLEMRTDGYESDRNRIIIYDIGNDSKFGLTEDWDRSPSSLVWGEDESTLFATAEDLGHKKLYVLEVPEGSKHDKAAAQPRALTEAHTVSAFSVLPSVISDSSKPKVPPSTTQILLSINSFNSPNEAYTLTVPASLREQPVLQKVSSVTTDLVDKLNLQDFEEFWFAGAAPNQQVHGFLFKPDGYVPGKKYGLFFGVHGGPQSAWTSSWSTRWNPQAFAAQGYVCVIINPTGSTGYGQAFTDAINKDWGGKPFKDLVAGLEFVKQAYKDLIDPERMVMLGASYGGYMANWIQGHNDVTGFKAIVCHDGILNTTSTWFGTEELYFPEHDLGGTPWEVPAEYDKWSPHNHVRNWKTPELVIHSGLDFRLPESEGIGIFNALQRKGVPSKLVYFPKENHWVLNPYNSRKWHQEVLAWMEEWVGTGPSE